MCCLLRCHRRRYCRGRRASFGGEQGRRAGKVVSTCRGESLTTKGTGEGSHDSRLLRSRPPWYPELERLSLLFDVGCSGKGKRSLALASLLLLALRSLCTAKLTSHMHSKRRDSKQSASGPLHRKDNVGAGRRRSRVRGGVGIGGGGRSGGRSIDIVFLVAPSYQRVNERRSASVKRAFGFRAIVEHRLYVSTSPKKSSKKATGTHLPTPS